MSRSKPELQLYRPGSGPLRKSGQECENKFDSGSNLSLNVYNRQYDNTNKFDLISSNINEISLSQSYHREELGSTCSLTSDYKRSNRNKKFDQQLYDPRRIIDKGAFNHQSNSNSMQLGGGNRSDSGRNHYDQTRHRGRDNKNSGGRNNNDGLTDNSNSSTHHRHRRGHGNRNRYDQHDGNDRRGTNEESWRASSPNLRYHQDRRDYRQTSEPRLIGLPSDVNRVRDTRSVEPMGPPRWNQDKIHSKPPSGRRNSTISMGSDGMTQQKPSKPPANFDSLPPRFKNKFYKNNEFNNANKNSEEPWDGSSVTFQGSGNGNYQQSNSRVGSPHQKQQMSHVGMGSGGNQVRGNYVPQSWSQTLPNMRGRGRGRIRQDDLEMERLCQQLSRSGTEKINMINHQVQSRPMTPPQYSNVIRTVSNESLNRCQQNTNKEYSIKVDRMYRGLHTPPPHVTTPPGQFRRNSITMESQQQVPTPRAPSPNVVHQQSPSSSKTPPEILDWSEEVEMCAEIEEGLSDAITRSSSMTSLVDHSCNTHPPRDKKSRRRRNRRKGEGRNRSSRDIRDKSTENGPRNQSNSSRENNSRNRTGYHSRDNSTSRESFKVPEFRGDSQSRGGHQIRNNTEGPRHRRRRDSRDSSGDRSRRNSIKDMDNRNWRDEIRDRRTSEKDTDPSKNLSCQAPGILVLPRGDAPVTESPRQNVSNPHPRHVQTPQTVQPAPQQKQLFDHHNPDKPIVVHATSSRISIPDQSRLSASDSSSSINVNNQAPNCWTDQFGNIRPPWYDPDRTRTTSKIHGDTEIADLQLQWLLNSGEICRDWERAMKIRSFLQESLLTMLRSDIKFCQTENVENYFWRILYYNIIEVLRKEDRPDRKEQSKQYLKQIIDEGTKYFESVLRELEQSYLFKVEDFLGSKCYPQPKGLGYVGLAIVSAQKVYIFLGDLARYKEQMNDTPSYGISRQYYVKAQQLNPKNGRPYYLLAVLANNVRRKLDAVYYYMRSLMTSNPFQSAKESLTSLFDDIRKKYEQTERKRREEKAERAKLHMKERERSVPGGNSLRREIWIHPEGGRRVHRTTSAQVGVLLDSDEEDISKLTTNEVNKRFNVSYLHVLGKLITKIGMETFQDAAVQMLKEFRALLQHSPIPLISNRLLQLLALNMYAIESSKLKEPQIEPRCRSEVQECALVVSLQMFNIILERCISLLREQLDAFEERTLPRIVGDDLQVIFPAVKVWCDWMLCNTSIWNPPPSCSDYKVGPPGDTWSRLAVLMNLLEKLDYEQLELVSEPPEDGFEMVRLPEDAMLSGFTPLMCNPLEIRYVSKDADLEVATVCWRLNRIHFFGTKILCGITPPVLKLQKFDSGHSEYISVVRTSQKGEDSYYTQDLSSDSDILVESFSEDEETDSIRKLEMASEITDATGDEIRGLLQRKEELKKRQQTQERHRERVQAILQQSVVSVEIEVKPRLLVPDTNCFIDYLTSLKSITEAQIDAQPIYILSVPTVVFTELEGLARGGKTPTPLARTSIDPAHIAKVAEAAKLALEFLRSRNPAVRCYTSRGTFVPLYTQTLEEDFDQDVGVNDDRILVTSLSLCRGSNKDQHNEGEPRRLYREVVLLTDDRNLRVKALARDVPVRELPDFMKWAGLG